MNPLIQLKTLPFNKAANKTLTWATEPVYSPPTVTISLGLDRTGPGGNHYGHY